MFVKICGITNQVDAGACYSRPGRMLSVLTSGQAAGVILSPRKRPTGSESCPIRLFGLGLWLNPDRVAYARRRSRHWMGSTFCNCTGRSRRNLCLNLVEADIPPLEGNRDDRPERGYLITTPSGSSLDTARVGSLGNRCAISVELGARPDHGESDLELHFGWGINARKRGSSHYRISAVWRGRWRAGSRAIRPQRYLPGPRFYCCCTLRLSVRKPAFEGVGNKTGRWSASCFNAVCFNQHRTTTMATFTFKLTCGTIAFLAAISRPFGQTTSPAPESTGKTAAKTNSAKSAR